MKWLILIFGVLSNASASILIKQAGNNLNQEELLKTPWKIFGNCSLLAGIFLYFLAFILYILALKEFPLHIAHPILTSGAIAIVAIFAFVFLEEPVSLMKFFVIIFILLGVIFLKKV